MVFPRSDHRNAIHNDKENPILPDDVPEAVSGGSPGTISVLFFVLMLKFWY